MPSAPAFSFGGRGVSRDPVRGAATSGLPGPGAYEQEHATGKQVASTRTTTPMPKFPVADRDQAAKVFAGTPTPDMVYSPGPAQYEVPIGSRGSGSPAKSSFAFGKEFGASGTSRRGAAFKGTPGPGAFDVRPRWARSKGRSEKAKSTFGGAARKNPIFDKQFAGPGMNDRAPLPTPSPKMMSQVSSIGRSVARPSSAAFSFGGRPKTVPRQRPPATPSSPVNADDRPRTAGSSGAGHSPGKRESKYSWINADFAQAAEASSRSTYQVQLDGPDLPRAREYRHPPKFSFGRDDRYSDKIYYPHKPVVRSDATPGPVYDIPETIGVEAPAYSFPRVADAGAAPAAARRAQSPGPGAYNIRLEHRMASMVEERFAEYEEIKIRASLTGGGDDEDDDDDDIESPRTVATFLLDAQSSKSPVTTPVGSAQTFGLKFGDLAKQQTAPAFSFGTSTRDDRAKHFAPGDLNKEIEGRASPGPGTAHPAIYSHAVTSRSQDESTPPTYSFGGRNIERNPLLKQASDVGPAAFAGRGSTGPQPSSRSATSPAVEFAKAPRKAIDRLFSPLDCNNPDPPHIPYGNKPGDPTPDHIYFSDSQLGVASIGRQVASTKMNSPKFKFSNSARGASR